MKTPASYGEMIAKYIGGILWSYAEYGSYQGDYIALIYKDSNLLIYKGSYGSCAGCDWLQSLHEDEDDILNEQIKKYMAKEKPFLSIPADSLPETEEELMVLLPANSRLWFDDEYNDCTIKDILKQIKSPTCDNLDIIESEAKDKKLI